MDPTGSGEAPVAGSCEHGNELSASITGIISGPYV